jgi:hypothetical protein
MYSVAGDMAEPNPTIPAQGKLPLSPASGQANHQIPKSSLILQLAVQANPQLLPNNASNR